MKHSRLAASLSFAVLFGAACAACTRSSIQADNPGARLGAAETDASQAGGEPSATKIATQTATVDTGGAPLSMTKIAAWTEAAAIDALAADCSVQAPSTEPGADTDPSPIACDIRWEQSCVYDPCSHGQTECEQNCAKSCGGCDAACTSTCSSCKTSCAAGAAGEACRRACATTTGSCRQSCLAKRDKCATADCAAAAKACAKNEVTKWKNGGCTGICPKVNACIGACQDDACNKACADRFPKCAIDYCIMGSAPEEPPRKPSKPGK